MVVVSPVSSPANVRHGPVLRGGQVEHPGVARFLAAESSLDEGGQLFVVVPRPDGVSQTYLVAPEETGLEVPVRHETYAVAVAAEVFRHGRDERHAA